MRPLHEEDPREAGPYRILARLGEGTTARVYLAAGPDGSPAALTVVRPDTARGREFRSLFARRTAAAATVDSPFAARVQATDAEGPVLWTASDYVAGVTLTEALRICGPLPEAAVRMLGVGVSEALRALHETGLVHGGLAPSGVVLTPAGPVLVSLGVTRADAVGTSVTDTGIILGTVLEAPGFRAPEQLRSRPAGTASDVFSLGSLLVHAATGTGPFGDETTSGLLDRVLSGEPDLEAVPAPLRAVLAAALAKDPADRPDAEHLRERFAGGTAEWQPAALSALIAQRAAQPWDHIPQPAGPEEVFAAADEPFGEQPFVEQPFVEEPFVEQPFTEAPFAEQQFAEESFTETSGPATTSAAYETEPEKEKHDTLPFGAPAGTTPPTSRRAARAARAKSGPSRRRLVGLAAAVGAVAAAGGIAAWASGRGGDNTASAASPSGPATQAAAQPGPPPTALQMWTRDNTLKPELLRDLAGEFRTARPRSVVEPQSQPQDRYGTLLDAALDAGDGPDVFELDVLQVARYAAAGRLADLTDHQEALAAAGWLPALKAACTVDDKVRAVPLSGRVPVVLYDKALYAAANVPVPKTREEWVAGLEALKAAHAAEPQFRSLYLPGKSWSVLASFIWEDGGAFAVRDGKDWRGTFDLPATANGARFFRHLQTSFAPEATAATAWSPPINEVLARGPVASIVAPEWMYPAVVGARPDMGPNLGAFPLPGLTAARPSAVGFEGSVLVVSAKCKDIPAAVGLLSLVASAPWRARLTNDGGLLPAVTALKTEVTPLNPMLQAGVAASQSGRAYPVAPGWTEKPLADFAAAVLGGGDEAVPAAAAAANTIVSDRFGKTR